MKYMKYHLYHSHRKYTKGFWLVQYQIVFAYLNPLKLGISSNLERHEENAFSTKIWEQSRYIFHYKVICISHKIL